MQTKNGVCTTRTEWRWEQVKSCKMKNHHGIWDTHLVVAYPVESLTNSGIRGVIRVCALRIWRSQKSQVTFAPRKWLEKTTVARLSTASQARTLVTGRGTSEPSKTGAQLKATRSRRLPSLLQTPNHFRGSRWLRACSKSCVALHPLLPFPPHTCTYTNDSRDAKRDYGQPKVSSFFASKA